jgi:hypothetical protein
MNNASTSSAPYALGSTSAAPPPPQVNTPPSQVNNPKPQAGNSPSLEQLDRAATKFREQLDKNIEQFSNRHMGARLFVYGLILLVVDIVIRLLQWVLIYVRGPAFSERVQIPVVPPSGIDDVFFLALLVVSVAMMAGGLFANLHLIWSIQRTQLEATQTALESVRTTSMIDELASKEPQAK